MLIANFARLLALISIPVAYFFYSLTFTHVFLVVFVVGAGTLLYQSALSKIVVTDFPQKNWQSINSYMEGSSSVTEVGGPGLGGLLVQLIGAPFSVLLDAFSYFISSALLLTSKSRKQDTMTQHKEAFHIQAVRDEKIVFSAGLRFLLQQKVLRSITFSAAHFNFFTAMFFGVYTFYLVRELGLSPLLVGLASVAGGVGGVISTLFATNLMNRISTSVLFLFSLLIPAGAAFLVPLANLTAFSNIEFIPVAISQFLWSFAIVVNLIMSESIKQILTSVSSIGQVSSAIRWVTLGVEPIGALLGGILATYLGATSALILSSFGLATALVWLFPQSGIRSFDLRVESQTLDNQADINN